MLFKISHDLCITFVLRLCNLTFPLVFLFLFHQVLHWSDVRFEYGGVLYYSSRDDTVV